MRKINTSIGNQNFLEMKLHNLLLLSLLAVLFAACDSDDDNGPDPDVDPIILSGTQSSPLTLDNIFSNPAATDYIVDGTFTIGAGVTVEPGVRITMTPSARIDINSSGSLTAVGTADNPIYIEGEQDARGYWDFIRFQSNNPNNRLEHCIISHGGGSSLSNRQAAVTLVDNAQLSLVNTVIQESLRNGLIITNSDNRLPEFENNIVTNCEEFPIAIRPQQLPSIDESTEFTTGNGFNRIAVGGTSVSSSVTINRAAGPYLFDGTTSFESSAEIGPGTLIEMGPGARIEVRSTGSLLINGTETERVTITGAEAAKGYWDFIYFNDSNSPNNQIHYADISYGGGSGLSSRTAIIGCRSNAFFAMSNSSITNSMRYGITLGGSSTWDDLGGNEFSGNELGDIND